MGKRIPIEIGENIFSTKKEALEFYSEILNSYNPGQELSNEDFELVFMLIRIHTNSLEKIGIGIKKLIVDNDEYGGKCFHIVREDNSRDNFSYRKAVNGEPNDFTNFAKACRKAIEGDLKLVKQQYFNSNSEQDKIKCQETNELISFEESHIDHRQPNTFSVIVDRFIEVNSIDISIVKYNKSEQYGHVFAENELSKKFQEYHKNKARLRVIKKTINLARSFQARVNKQKKDITIN